MATVRSNNHEPLESMLRKFKKKVVKEGIMEDMKKKEFYKKPSIKKKEKKVKQQENWLRNQLKNSNKK